MNKFDIGSKEFAFSSPIGRRTFLRSTAAGAVAGMMFAPSVRAQESGVIKVGIMSSISGPRAAFSECSEWMRNLVAEKLKDGLEIGGKNYKVELLLRDTQSAPDRSGQVGNDLLLRDQVDLLLADDPDSHYTVAPLCDQMGIPYITTMISWDQFIQTRGSSNDRGYPWSFDFFWSGPDLGQSYVAAWEEVKTNKVFGDLYLDHPSSVGFSDAKTGIPGRALAKGYTRSEGGWYKGDTDDFSVQIAKWKRDGTGILAGFMYPPHFVTLWNQMAQAGLKPDVVTVAAAFAFPSGLEALGDQGDGMATEVWWTPGVPFSSSLTGHSARQLADKYTADTGRQWTQPIGYIHALYEVGIAALKGSGDPKNREAVRDAVTNMNLNTMVGPVNFKDSDVKSVAKTQIGMGQWRRQDKGPFKYELYIVGNELAPDIKIERELVLLSKL